MKQVLKYVFLWLLAVGMVACEERIELDVAQVPEAYAIDGLVSNKYKKHYVRIKKAVDFYDAEPAPDVKDARVEVTDNAGNVYSYTWSETFKAYLSDVAFSGVVGRVYHLKAEVNERVFYASDSMRPISEITEVTWAIDPVEERNPMKNGYFYQAMLTTTEPQETVDFYLFNIYRNDSIKRFDDHTGVFVTDDIAIGERIENFPAPIYYAMDDWAKFEVYSLTPEAYEYYYGLSQLLNNDGGMFSSTPANPLNNIIGEGGLGFFQVSAIASDSVKIGDPQKKAYF